jgi:hypothetical protein
VKSNRKPLVKKLLEDLKKNPTETITIDEAFLALKILNKLQEQNPASFEHFRRSLNS